MKKNVIVVAAKGSLPAEIARIDALANVILVESLEEFVQARERADTVYMWQWDSEIVAQAGPDGLAWVHVNSIGVDALLTSEIAESSTVVTNVRGVFETPVAEWVLSALLFLAKDLRGTVELQQRGIWKPRPIDLVRGRRALVLGPGHVGREVTRLLGAVGYDVVVVGRTARHEVGLGWVHAVAELDELLASVDDVILAAPLTTETRGIMSADRLARLRRGARLVNVGRGSLIDEYALLEHLTEGHLGAAALDVFNEEPLPPSHPFWSMTNVLVSPHMAMHIAGWERSTVDLFVQNLERHIRGDDLMHVVDTRALVAGPSHN